VQHAVSPLQTWHTCAHTAAGGVSGVCIAFCSNVFGADGFPYGAENSAGMQMWLEMQLRRPWALAAARTIHGSTGASEVNGRTVDDHSATLDDELCFGRPRSPAKIPTERQPGCWRRAD